MSSNDLSWTVYRITSLDSGKQYIGITKRTVSRRWMFHRVHSRSTRYRNYNSPLQRSIRKYGEDRFSIEIMYTAVSLREACAVEKGLIATYGTFAPSGYNLTIGGEGTQGHRKILSSEHRQKISEAHKGKIFTSQHRENIRTAKLGRSLTDEHREKLSRATRGRPKSPERREQMRLVHLNRPPTGKSGVKGVSPLPPNGWVANLTIGVKKRLYLGYFKSIEAAAAAIEDAKEKYLVARPTTVSAVPLG